MSGTHPSPTTVHTTGSVALAVGGRLEGPADLPLTSLAAVDQAGPAALTFVRSGKFAAGWDKSLATAALVTKGVDLPLGNRADRALIHVDDADLAMIKVLGMFAWPISQPAVGRNASATIDASAKIAPTVRIGPGCVIGARTSIADGCVLHPNVTLGADCTIGPGSVLFPGVVMYDRCSVGAQCILHANVVLGADGFGYRPDPQGRGLIKIPHIGTVQIGNGVEIGANSAVDRGKFGATTIGDGTKIDNLVQIGHNVRIGRACIICGVTGVGGSVVMEDGVVIAGQVGVQDGRRIGTRAIISAMAGVMSDVPAGETFFGSPAGRHKDQMRALVALRQLSDHLRTQKRLSENAGLSPEVEPPLDRNAQNF